MEFIGPQTVFIWPHSPDPRSKSGPVLPVNCFTGSTGLIFHQYHRLVSARAAFFLSLLHRRLRPFNNATVSPPPQRVRKNFEGSAVQKEALKKAGNWNNKSRNGKEAKCENLSCFYSLSLITLSGWIIPPPTS